VIRPQPSTLDAATLEGMVALYMGPRQRAMLERYAAQARRWEAQARTAAHQCAVQRLVDALVRLRAFTVVRRYRRLAHPVRGSLTPETGRIGSPQPTFSSHMGCAYESSQ